MHGTYTFLKQYEKYGFERTKSVPYDTKNYGEPPQNLKDAWKAQGWKEGDPYPSVQYMKLKEGEGSFPEENRAPHNQRQGNAHGRRAGQEVWGNQVMTQKE